MIIVAIASVVLSVGWHDGAWKWELPIGIPISFVLTILTAVAIHVFNLVPDRVPHLVLPVGLAHLVLGGHHRARMDPGPLDPAGPFR